MDVWALYEDRREAVTREYWRPNRVALRALASEREATIERLFSYVEQLGGAESGVSAIREKYRYKRLLACIGGADVSPSAFAATINRLDAAEVEEARLVTGSNAVPFGPLYARMQAELAPLRPTQAEFDSLSRARAREKELAEKAGSYAALMADPGKRAELDAVREQLIAEIGPERFEEAALKSDPAHQAFYEVVSDLGLPESRLDDLAALQQEILGHAERHVFQGEEGAQWRRRYRDRLVELIGEEGLRLLGARARYIFHTEL
jgi:hypothetical protein